MNDRTKELAEQAGFEPMAGGYHGYDDNLELFAELIRQDAMEEAAKICDQLNYNGMNSLHCAQAIRNRAEEDLL